jgi:hypothetical protein
MFQFLFEGLTQLTAEKLFSRTMSEDNARAMLDDPIYKENVQKLIERNRRFEETRE